MTRTPPHASVRSRPTGRFRLSRYGLGLGILFAVAVAGTGLPGWGSILQAQDREPISEAIPSTASPVETPQSELAPQTIVRPQSDAADLDTVASATATTVTSASAPVGFWPLVVLGIGMAIVLTMIVGLRINAFLALLAAALVVSLLAGGGGDSAMVRVTQSLGKHAGNIGIIIAMAAIIGDCMLRSGAADRIVQFFLALFGQKRSGIALSASGFVLAIPVFFDTVFYLLVPLARSLYRRTGRNYVKYLLAIVVGGATTHALVPPTPGPLLIASNLGFDIGTMIMVGTIIGIPTAAVGLLVAGLVDRLMPIPMRPIGGEPADPVADGGDPAASHRADPIEGGSAEALGGEELGARWMPPLPLALLPVMLPVVLIASNTLLNTLADNEQTTRFSDADRAVVERLADAVASDAEANPQGVGGRIRDRFQAADDKSVAIAERTGRAASPSVTSLLTAPQPRSQDEIDRLIETFNTTILRDRTFYQADNSAFAAVDNRIVKKLASEDRSRMSQASVERMNRLVLEAAFPGSVPEHTWETPLRRTADLTALPGNSSFALILATVVALALVVWAEGNVRKVLSDLIERSLMSAGVIILITASGGAFGDMLTAAKVGDAIQGLFATEGAALSGVAMLGLGFLIASVLKIAQGSTTVAMITASGMLAGVASAELLGFHPVYLAVAIAGGSTFGSWMNDSGFWIFTKMGGLTESESLRSWTVGLATVGVVSFLLSVVLALVMPLT